MGGHLDPTAQEFIPSNPSFPLPHIPLGLSYATPHLSYTTTSPPPNIATSPTRSLLITPFQIFITESLLRTELQVFGDVRGVQMENLLTNGTVTVHFYDLRHAQTALTAIQGQHIMQQTRLRNYYYYYYGGCGGGGSNLFNSPPLPPPARGLIAGRAVWAQFALPACNAVPDGQNQGTIVVFNLDREVSAKNVRQVFETFGPIKELRERPNKKNQRLIEFYDIRDAANALKNMDGKKIHGKVVVIEYSREGEHNRKFYHSNKPINLNDNVLSPPSPFSPPSSRFSFKKSSSVNKRSAKKVRNSAGTIEEAVSSMNLSEEVVDGVEKKRLQQQQQHSNGSSRKNSIKKHSSCESMIESTKHGQETYRGNRHWKGKQRKNHDTQFLIQEDAIVESGCRDTRTTVMIKNIPNKYSQKLLLNMLDSHCIQCNEQIGDCNNQPLSSFDFLYLPIDFNNKCNVGYGFVNMTSPEATMRLYKAFHHKHWEVFNSRKICQVTYARVQGLEALKEHFKNSRFPCELDHHMPVMFSPPRDGMKELTEPFPIVANSNNKTIPIPITISVTNSSEDSSSIRSRSVDDNSEV
ncbi:hypothetical protein TanjilG_11019 [Lupinus angustifolius]|uniref:RRM domain-containing protein n=1 Tax=Lupinus angustifolius TaxID=3871 RepID=A0A1J7GAU9_LUPAN|nr:PREDICTED: protein terminal ear1 homolog [Lupinus angustifolius]OIV97495.1 hypothetical protein TanjilG_11019 [Lupinus angustifolius]